MGKEPHAGNLVDHRDAYGLADKRWEAGEGELGYAYAAAQGYIGVLEAEIRRLDEGFIRSCMVSHKQGKGDQP